MGGLVIDIVIAFVIKSALRLRRAWGSGNWQRVKARVDSSCLAGGWIWNCPTTEVAYTYKYAGQTYSAIDSNPFLSESSAEVELEWFRPGEHAVVRVNPMQPQKVGDKVGGPTEARSLTKYLVSLKIPPPGF